jgi:hypothetical protein
MSCAEMISPSTCFSSFSLSERSRYLVQSLDTINHAAARDRGAYFSCGSFGVMESLVSCSMRQFARVLESEGGGTHLVIRLNLDLLSASFMKIMSSRLRW